MNMEARDIKARKPRSARAIAFYSQCRAWHGYISAFAFLTLIFFAASGILLNHPDWLTSDGGEPRTATASISAADIGQAQKAADPGAALGQLVAEKMRLVGAFSSADLEGDQAILRYEGVKGSSDVTLDLRSGAAHARLKPADPVTMLDDLHRGKNAGPVWQTFIDLSGALILILSLVGYVLFFAMRFRLRTAMVLTGLSIAGLASLFLFFVP
jgi:hypothetical protein